MLRIQTGPERGDCTASYAIEFRNEEYTVKTFVEAILKNTREWGTIGIYVPIGKRKSITDAIKGNPYIEYHWGEQKGEFPTDILDKKVVGASGDGGWSNMDYLLMLEGMEEE